MRVTATFDVNKFKQVVDKQLSAMKSDGAGFMAEAIVNQMKQNVDNGKAFEQDKYEEFYSQRSVDERRAKGYGVDKVDLQRARKRVKTAKVTKTSEKAIISFDSGGFIMQQHNFGLAHLPRRQLFPDIQGGWVDSPGNGKLENPSAMPKKIVNDTHKFGAKLMNNV